MKTYFSSQMPVLSQDPFLVCDHTFCTCTCVWESQWILFTLEESEMPGSPVLKLTGPFGSNHQMCHGKTATSWCKGRQDVASINIFLQGWQWLSFWLGLCTCVKFLSTSLQVIILRVCNKKNNCLSLVPLSLWRTWSIVYCDWQTETKERKGFISVTSSR